MEIYHISRQKINKVCILTLDRISGSFNFLLQELQHMFTFPIVDSAIVAKSFFNKLEEDEACAK